MAADGNEIATLSEAETDRIKGLGDEVIADWIKEMNGRRLDAGTLVSDCRAAVQVTRDAQKNRDFW